MTTATYNRKTITLKIPAPVGFNLKPDGYRTKLRTDALLALFGGFNKVRHEYDIDSLPVIDMEIKIGEVIYKMEEYLNETRK